MLECVRALCPSPPESVSFPAGQNCWRLTQLPVPSSLHGKCCTLLFHLADPVEANHIAHLANLRQGAIELLMILNVNA